MTSVSEKQLGERCKCVNVQMCMINSFFKNIIIMVAVAAVVIVVVVICVYAVELENWQNHFFSFYLLHMN